MIRAVASARRWPGGLRRHRGADAPRSPSRFKTGAILAGIAFPRRVRKVTSIERRLSRQGSSVHQMLRIVLVVIAGAAGQSAFAADPPAASTRPNILIVMTDDQGLGDFSFMGNPVLTTPNLDRFARESVRLVDFH